MGWNCNQEVLRGTRCEYCGYDEEEVEVDEGVWSNDDDDDDSNASDWARCTHCNQEGLRGTHCADCEDRDQLFINY